MKTFIIKNKKPLFYIVGILILLGVWFVLYKIVNNPVLIPSFKMVITELFNTLTTISTYKIIGFTILRVLITIALSLLISLLILILYITCPNSLYFFKPLITFMKSTPIACITILLFFLIGSTLSPYVIASLMVLPVMIEGLTTGVNNINQEIIDDLTLMPRKQIYSFFKVYLPLIKQHLIMTLMQTLGLGFKVMIMAEYICQTNNSIGKTIYNIKANFTTMTELLTWIIIIVFFVIIIEYLIKKVVVTKKNKEVKIN